MAIKKMLRVKLRDGNEVLREIIDLKIEGDDYLLRNERGEIVERFTRDRYESVSIEQWDNGEIPSPR